MSENIDDLRAFAAMARGGCCEGGRCHGRPVAPTRGAERIASDEEDFPNVGFAVTEDSILAEADKVAGEDRSRDYGHPKANHERIAAIWNVQIGSKLKESITAREVALMMIGLKLAREANSPKRDNILDIAGYVKCVDMIDEAS
jgi:hypothetical protein